MRLDARGMHYRELNDRIHAAVAKGVRDIDLDNVHGQRYIGAGFGVGIRLTVNGVPGNDLGAFMNGAEIIVNGNAQDGVGNTMNDGKIVIHGGAGDVTGYAMRGGRVYLKGDAGYRAGIHMKAYMDRFPVVVIGGTAKDYLGEYMAGGVLIVLGMGGRRPSPVGDYAGTGMHGGVIYIRGAVEPHQVGREVGIEYVREDDWRIIEGILAGYCAHFRLDTSLFRMDQFIRLVPRSTRPYGKLYAY